MTPYVRLLVSCFVRRSVTISKTAGSYTSTLLAEHLFIYADLPGDSSEVVV